VIDIARAFLRCVNLAACKALQARLSRSFCFYLSIFFSWQHTLALFSVSDGEF
jgi:hypothetical protein